MVNLSEMILLSQLCDLRAGGSFQEHIVRTPMDLLRVEHDSPLYRTYRHLHCAVRQVIGTVADAVDFACALERDILLPEWPSTGA